MGNWLGLRNQGVFAPLWVYDFLCWNGTRKHNGSMPNTILYRTKPEDLDKFYSDDPRDLEQVNANAYDFVLTVPKWEADP